MATKKTVKKTTVKKPVVKKAVKKEESPTAMTRASFVETITDMCERLNDSGLLDELNTVELEDGLTAEQLTDLFCDAVEFVDSVDKSGELDDDIVKFYESEPWKDLPDEDEEQEPEDEDLEPEDDTPDEDPEEEAMDEDPEGEPEPEEDAVEEEPESEPEPTPKKKAVKAVPKKTVSKTQKEIKQQKTVKKETTNKQKEKTEKKEITKDINKGFVNLGKFRCRATSESHNIMVELISGGTIDEICKKTGLTSSRIKQHIYSLEKNKQDICKVIYTEKTGVYKVKLF